MILILVLTIICYKYIVLSAELNEIHHKLESLHQQIDNLDTIDEQLGESIDDLEEQLTLKIQTEINKISDRLTKEIRIRQHRLSPF